MDGLQVSRILLADDGSEAAAAARRLAVSIAAAAPAKLSVVYVLEPLEEASVAEEVLAPARALAAGAGLACDVIAAPPVGVTNVGRRIIGAAQECGADLIVVGARGRGGLGRLLLGSVSDYVVRNADRSVLVARG